MRVFNVGLKSHLSSTTTTTCSCWIVHRGDGQSLGFTDHDKKLIIEGIECLASSGFQSTEAISDLGFSVDNQDIEGVISSDAITDDDLKAGRFDNARVEIWIVNWANVEERHHLRTAVLGEVKRQDHLFKAELRGITSLLDQRNGRTYSRGCDAVLGDKKCRVDLADAAMKVSSEVIEVIDRLLLRCSDISSFPKNWFSYGNLTWTSGKNVGLSVEINGTANSGNECIRLWKAMPFEVGVGDTFLLTAGCDKSFSVCKSKFSNTNNFQGFPHLPGADFALGYAETGALHNGSPLVK